MSPTDSYTEGTCYSFGGLLDGDAPFAMQKPMTLAFAAPGWEGMTGNKEDPVLEKKQKA